MVELCQEKTIGRGKVDPEIGPGVSLLTRVFRTIQLVARYVIVDVWGKAGRWGYWAAIAHADFFIRPVGSDAYIDSSRYSWCRHDSWVREYLPRPSAVVFCKLYAR